LVPLTTGLGDVLTARQTDLGDLAGKGRAVLDQVANRAPKLPNLVNALDGFLGAWVADLSQGPNWRIFVTTALASGHAYPPGAEPSDATGLLNTDVVKVAGVTVGKVAGAKVDIDRHSGRAKAVVDLKVRKDVAIPDNARAAIRFRNLLGQRMVVITRDPAQPDA